MKRMALAALIACLPVGALTCGGTTGREGLTVGTNGVDATVSVPVGGDEPDDASIYTDAFDVAIAYVDQALPDAATAAEGGSGSTDAGQAGSGLPDCPPFLSLDSMGKQVDPSNLQNAVIELPSAYAGDGGVTLAPDGSACATYPWLGSVALDQCLVNTEIPGNSFDLFPPCDWAEDSGAATAGPGTGEQRYDLCIAYYQCMMRTQCWVQPLPTKVPQWATSGFFDCLCTVPIADLQGGTSLHQDCLSNPNGPCLQEGLAAMELGGDVQSALMTFFGQTDQPYFGPGSEGRNLNYEVEQLANYCIGTCPTCYPDAGGD
jgi:hypothetical protein